MDKHSIRAFRIGEEIAELQRDTENYWIIYVDMSELSILSQQECYHGKSGQIIVVALTNNQIQLCPKSNFAGFVLQVSDSVSAELVKRYMLFMSAAEADVNVFTAGKQEQSVRTVFQNMVAEMHGNLESSETLMHLLLQELMIRLQRTSQRNHSAAHSNRTKVVASVCSLLEKEYSNSCSLESIAASYNMSISYLSHIFKEVTGVPLMRYLLLVRIRVAQEYLSQTTLHINEIAEKCGFNDVSNFGRTFKNETGYSPRQYRQMHMKQL